MQYLDLILTLHAQAQIKERGMKISDVYQTFKTPDRISKNKYGNASDFEKQFDDYKITVVAFQNNKNEWVAKTAWRNPELPGTHDARKKEHWKKMNRSGFWGKIYLTIKQQLGF